PTHARRGAECRHTLAYWRYQDYLGIGPGAHGRVSRGGGKIATQQHRAPETWLTAIEDNGTAGVPPACRPEAGGPGLGAFAETTAVARDEAVEEMVMVGLRLVEGVSRPRLETLAERDVAALFGDAL